MALTKVPVTLHSGNINPGSSKAAPQLTTGTFDCNGYHGASVLWRIVNSSSAPGVALQLTVQVSDDGAFWVDLYTVGGNTAVSGSESGAIPIDRTNRYMRLIAYGNTVNVVALDARLQAITSL